MRFCGFSGFLEDFLQKRYPQMTLPDLRRLEEGGLRCVAGSSAVCLDVCSCTRLIFDQTSNC